MIALAAALLLAWQPQSSPAPTPLRVQVALPAPLAGAAEELLRTRVVALADAEFRSDHSRLDDVTARRDEGPLLLFGASEHTLSRLARSGALVRNAVPGDALPPRARDAAGRYGLLFTSRHGMVDVPGALPPEARPRSWEELALMPELTDRIGLPDPALDPTPWLGGMAGRLARGEGPEAGYALWTTLDARAGRYFGSWQELVTAVESGAVAVAVMPHALAARGRELRGLPPLPCRDFADGAPVQLLGLAVLGPGSLPPGLVEAIRRLCEPELRRDLALRLGLQPLAEAGDTADDPPDWQLAEAWLAHFRERIRGRGRQVEDIDRWLDLAFGVLFAVFLLFVYLKLRRSEPDGRSEPET